MKYYLLSQSPFRNIQLFFCCCFFIDLCICYPLGELFNGNFWILVLEGQKPFLFWDRQALLFFFGNGLRWSGENVCGTTYIQYWGGCFLVGNLVHTGVSIRWRGFQASPSDKMIPSDWILLDWRMLRSWLVIFLIR